MKVCAVILESYVGRKGRKYFDHDFQYGYKAIIDIIEREYKIKIGYVSLPFIGEYDIALIGIHSAFDIYNLIFTFEKFHLSAEEVKTKIIIGGTGMINAKPILKYGDFFIFGRGEELICQLIKNIMNGRTIESPNIFNRERNSFGEKFIIKQAGELLDFNINGKKEESIGCPNKCYFCAYTFHRKSLNKKYLRGGIGLKSSKTGARMTFRTIEEISHNADNLVGIDGVSDRLRFAFNKKISDNEIIRKISNILQSGKIQSEYLELDAYYILGYPTETKKERLDSIRLWHFVNNISGTKLHLHFRYNIFRPMPLTPAYWCPSEIKSDIRQEIMYLFRDRIESSIVPLLDKSLEKNIRVFFNGNSFQGNLCLLMDMIYYRGGIEARILLKNIIFNKKIKNNDYMTATKMILNSLSKEQKQKYFGRYEIGDWGEMDYLDGYFPRTAIDFMARKLEKSLYG